MEDSDIDLLVVSDDFEDVPFENRIAFLQRNWNERRNGRVLEAFGYRGSEFSQLQKFAHLVREATRHGLVIAYTILHKFSNYFLVDL